MEKPFVISADSNCELPPTLCKEKGIEIIDLGYQINGEEKIFDYQDSSAKEFYQAMREGVVPTTMQKNAEECKEFWRTFLDEGKDILHLSFSSKLSGTYNSAVMAQREIADEYPDQTICVIDTKSITWTMGLLLLRCTELQEEGMLLQEMVQWVEDNKQGYGAFFTVDSLEYLKRSGRVSHTSAFIGTMLQIKPILYLDEQGGLTPIEKVKGRKKAIRRLVECAAAKISLEFDKRYVILHADCMNEAIMLQEYAAELLPEGECLGIYSLGPVIGTHVGPGTLALISACLDRKINS